MRLRDVLRRVMGVSYTAMKSAKWNGGITVDGVVTPVDAFVRAGQLVAIRFRENAPAYAVKPYDLPLTIAHEDDWLFVIDKPAPLASHPAPCTRTTRWKTRCTPICAVRRISSTVR